MTVSLPLNIRQNLRNLGFSENDIQVLSLLFYIESATLKQISQQSAISYSTCQYVTTNLIRIGILESVMIENEEHIKICSQQKFLDWIEIQKQKSDAKYEENKEDIKAFFNMVQESSWRPNLTYFEGKEGIKAIYQDILDSGADIVGWTDISQIQETLGDFMDYYIEERMKKGMKSSSIRPINSVNQEYAKKEQKRETKFSDQMPISGEIRIYDSKVAVITFDKKHPVGFIIESKMVSDMYRSIFSQNWNLLNPEVH